MPQFHHWMLGKPQYRISWGFFKPFSIPLRSVHTECIFVFSTLLVPFSSTKQTRSSMSPISLLLPRRKKERKQSAAAAIDGPIDKRIKETRPSTHWPGPLRLLCRLSLSLSLSLFLSLFLSLSLSLSLPLSRSRSPLFTLAQKCPRHRKAWHSTWHFLRLGFQLFPPGEQIVIHGELVPLLG